MTATADLKINNSTFRPYEPFSGAVNNLYHMFSNDFAHADKRFHEIEMAVKSASANSSDDNVPYQMGWNYPSMKAGELFIAMLSAPTVFDALKLLNNHYEHFSLFGEKISIDANEDLRIEIVFPWESSKNIFLQMVASSRIHRLLFDLFGSAFTPERIANFSFANSLCSFFALKPSVIKKQSSVSFHYRNSVFAIKMQSEDQSSFNHYVNKLERMYRPSSSQDSHDPVAMTDYLFNTTSTNLWKKDYFAEKMDLSTRSYDRLLKKHNTSFTTIFRRHIRSRAMSCLMMGNTVSFAAEELGYSEPKSFVRAFNSFSPISATEYRNLAVSFQCDSAKKNIVSENKYPLFSRPEGHIVDHSRTTAMGVDDVISITNAEPVMMAKAICYASTSCDLYSLNINDILPTCFKQAGVMSMLRQILISNQPSNEGTSITAYYETWNQIMLMLELIPIFNDTYPDSNIDWSEVYLTALLKNIGLLYLLDNRSNSFFKDLDKDTLNSLNFNELSAIVESNTGINLLSLTNLILLRWGCDARLADSVSEIMKSTQSNGNSTSLLANTVNLLEQTAYTARIGSEKALRTSVEISEAFFRKEGLKGHIPIDRVNKIIKSVLATSNRTLLRR